MKAPISELSRKIINSGGNIKTHQDKFEFEGKTYIVKKGLPSIKKKIEEE